MGSGRRCGRRRTPVGERGARRPRQGVAGHRFLLAGAQWRSHRSHVYRRNFLRDSIQGIRSLSLVNILVNLMIESICDEIEILYSEDKCFNYSELLGNYNEVEILEKRLLKSVAREYILLFVGELKFCNCLIVILYIF